MHISTLFRNFCAFLFALAVVPIVGNFFVELARQKGWYNDPEGTVNTLLAFIQSTSDHWSYPYVLGAALGLLVGAWGHRFAVWYDKKSEALDADKDWAKGLGFISIRDAGCAYAGVKLSEAETSSRAKAISNEILEKTRSGWIQTVAQKETRLLGSGAFSIRLAGHPPFGASPDADLKTVVTVASLRDDFSKSRKDLDRSWLPS